MPANILFFIKHLDAHVFLCDARLELYCLLKGVSSNRIQSAAVDMRIAEWKRHRDECVEAKRRAEADLATRRVVGDIRASENERDPFLSAPSRR